MEQDTHSSTTTTAATDSNWKYSERDREGGDANYESVSCIIEINVGVPHVRGFGFGDQNQITNVIKFLKCIIQCCLTRLSQSPSLPPPIVSIHAHALLFQMNARLDDGFILSTLCQPIVFPYIIIIWVNYVWILLFYFSNALPLLCSVANN